jgi:spermidine/putrescine transport system substrate-binding protein
MKRRTLLLGGAAAACGRGPRLNVYNWSDYIAPETVPQFERESGVRVHYGTYESNQEMLAQVMSGNSGWDVVFPSGDFIEPMRALRLLAPLDRALLPNLSALSPEFQRPPWDPELRWAIPYMHGVTGILYQSSLRPAPSAWSDLWDARLRGRLTMLDDEPEVLGACLKKLRYSINSAAPATPGSSRAEAAAARLPERRSAGPGRRRRRSRCPSVGRHRRASHRGCAWKAGVCVSQRWLPAIRR